MPASDTLLWFQRALLLEQRWHVDGTHYQRTANQWLANQDARRNQVMSVLADAYVSGGAPWWFQPWRMFWMSCTELFGESTLQSRLCPLSTTKLVAGGSGMRGRASDLSSSRRISSHPTCTDRFQGHLRGACVIIAAHITGGPREIPGHGFGTRMARNRTNV